MSQSFSFTGKLLYPPDVGVTAPGIPVDAKGTFDSQNAGVYNLSGAGSQAVSLGTITGSGVKQLLIEVDASTNPSAAPVMVQFNAGGTSGQVELSPGGCLVIASPNPTASGILSVLLVHTTDNVVRVHSLG